MTERRPLRTELAPDARTMARGAAANVGGALTATVLSFALSLLITHEIRAGAFGLYSIALVTVLLGQVVATLGLDVGAVRFVALRASQGDEEGARGSLQAAVTVVAGVSSVLALVLYWQAPWLAGSFFHKPLATELVRIVAFSLPALALTRVVIGSLQGLGVMRYSALVNPIRVAANIAVALPVLLLGYEAKGLSWAFLAASWATLVVAVALLLRALPAAFVPVLKRWQVRPLLRFSLPQTLTAMLLQTILWTDTLLLGRLRVRRSGRLHDRAAPALPRPDCLDRDRPDVRAADRGRGRTRRPRHARGDVEARHLLERLACDPRLCTAAGSYPGPLLHLLGRHTAKGATALTILAAGQLFNAATGPLGQVINMSGRPYLTLLNNAAVAALNIVGCLILIPRYGITGAACSTTAAITLVNIVKLAQVRMLFGINPFRAETGRALLAGALATAVVAPLALLVDWPSAVLQVVVTAAVLVPLYAAFFWWSAAGPEERELLRLRGRPLLAVKSS